MIRFDDARRYTANSADSHLGYAATKEDAQEILKRHGAEDTGYVFDTHLHCPVYLTPVFRPMPGLAEVADRELTAARLRELLKPMISYAVGMARAAQQNHRCAVEHLVETGEESDVAVTAAEALAAELLVAALDEAEVNASTLAPRGE